MDPTRKIRRAFTDIGVAPTEAAATLRSVGLPDVERVLQSYPHQLSGGMAQRAGIALALARKPTLLIADEPTSALDADVAGAVLEQLLSLVRASGAALVLITHDLSIVEKHCQRVVVMHSGEILEDGPVDEVLSRPAASYTKALLAATGLLHSQPRQQRPSEVETVIDVRDVTVDFQTGPPWERRTLRALDERLAQHPARRDARNRRPIRIGEVDPGSTPPRPRAAGQRIDTRRRTTPPRPPARRTGHGASRASTPGLGAEPEPEGRLLHRRAARRRARHARCRRPAPVSQT